MRKLITTIAKPLAHLLLLALFMFLADHWQRANYDRFMRWTNWAVNAGGMLAYLVFLWVIRAIRHR